MGNIALKENAELNLDMEAMTEETEGHCDEWNTRYKQLLENEKYFEEKRKEYDQELEKIKLLRASFEAYGMVKVTDSAVVTDSTGLALAATEKNASIQGTLANQISSLNTDILKILGAYVIFQPITVKRTYNKTAWTFIDEFTYTLPQRSIFVSTIHVPISRNSDGYVDYFFNERFGSCKCEANVISFIDRVVVGVENSGYIIRLYIGSNENWITAINGSEDNRLCFAEHLIIPLE